MSHSRGGNASADHSETDDWTLLSPPHSSSSSSHDEELISEPKLESIHSSSSSCSSLEKPEDGLLEIDLNETSDLPIEVKYIQNREAQKREKPEEEQHDLTDIEESLIDNPTDANDSYTIRKRPMMHKVEVKKLELVASINPKQKSPQNLTEDDLIAVENELDQHTLMETDVSRSTTTSDDGVLLKGMKLQRKGISDECLVAVGCVVFSVSLMAVLNHLLPFYAMTHGSRSSSPSVEVCYRYVGNMEPVYRKNRLLSKQHHLDDLKSLHSDLSNCIRRQNPTSFSYHMSLARGLKETRPPPDVKPFRGLVCYEQEAKWRKRIKRLKTDHGIDLISVTQEVKRRVTNQILQIRGLKTGSKTKEDLLDINLILNQIEYLDYVERERNKRRLEESLKHITAENMQLVRSIKRPNSDYGNQRSFATVELENIRLQRENAELKANLMEKVGPIYMKQALELEAYERENIALKKFYHQVAKDVSKSLKQFNLHLVDTPDVIGDNENLNAQLMVTRGHLRRLSEKISTVLIENEGLKDELKEIYLMSVHNKAASQAIQNGNGQDRTKNETTNVLLADSCLKSLMESRDRSKRLELELDNLRRNCSSVNVDLENSRERHLNKPADDSSTGYNSSGRKWLSSASRTELDRRESDISSLKTEAMVDEFISFLTEFNAQIESEKGLARVESNSDQLYQSPYLESEKSGSDDHTKVIPIYIREAIRSAKSSLDTATSGGQVSASHDEGHIKLPPTPPSMYRSSLATGKINISHSCLEVPTRSNANIDLQDEPIALGTQNVSTDAGSIYNDLDTFRDTWFFKRAKQRRRLRRNGQKSPDYQTDWLTKRAKLREKLRKASTYIDNYYKPMVGINYRPVRDSKEQYIHNQRAYEYTGQHDSKRNRQHQGGEKKYKSGSKQYMRNRK